MKRDIKLKGQLKMYMQWPAIMTVLLIAMNLWIYLEDRRAGALMSAFIVVYAVIVGVLYFYNKSLILADLIEFAAQYGIVQNTLLKELSIPYAILMEDGKIAWMNDKCQELMGIQGKKDNYIGKMIPELRAEIYPKEEGERIEIELAYQNREYIAELRNVSVESFSETEQLLQLPKEREYLIALSLNDMTEINEYVRENEEQRLVAGLIYLDNYEEVMESVEEVRQSLLLALIDRKVNQYIAKADGIVKKLEKDKYFIVIKRKHFKALEKDRFTLLEDVKSVNIGNESPATLSIGLGFSTDTYSQSYNYARVAIDLALARGGDQAVIKDCHGITYFGGKREQTAKNTRVKARVKAEALKEFMMAKETIIISGHKIADVDSLGASIGIYRAALSMEKKAHIVLNDITMSVRPIFEAFRDNPAYPDDMFIQNDQAMHLVNENTMVVVVDTNKPSITDCEEVLQVAKTIVVLDHHRQGSTPIDNAILSYIEPYASSACEMVAEVLQYMVDDIKIPSIEASSMYAGMIIDTNNFTNRTGVRTFEAAAFLRRCGADITYVRKLLRDDMNSYRTKAEIISHAEVYHNQFAIARGGEKDVESPTIVGAQAANELLNINQIKASFVLTKYNGKIYVSARSIDEVNVQLIMERIGGGGHINAAGAQFEHTRMDEAIDTLKQTIDIMIEEGDI